MINSRQTLNRNQERIRDNFIRKEVLRLESRTDFSVKMLYFRVLLEDTVSLTLRFEGWKSPIIISSLQHCELTVIPIKKQLRVLRYVNIKWITLTLWDGGDAHTYYLQLK
jgi:hypothetical protein